MQKYKILSKYLFKKKYSNYSLKIKYFLYKNEIENSEKLKNLAFLQFFKNFQISYQEDSKSFLDYILNFQFEKYLIFDILVSKIIKLFNNMSTIYKNEEKTYNFKETKEDIFISNKQKEIAEQGIKNNFSGEIFLYKFEIDFIKRNLLKKNSNFTKYKYESEIRQKNIHSIRKISLYNFKNKKSSKDTHFPIFEFREVSTKENNNDKIESKSNLKATNNFYYNLLLKEIKSEAKRFNSSQINFETELNFIKRKIITKRISSIRSKTRKFIRMLNIKNLLDLKNTKNTIHATFNILSKYIALYKQSMNELVEGQREVTNNKNFRFEDGESVKEKLEKFERKLKENVNLNDHYEKKLK